MHSSLYSRQLIILVSVCLYLDRIRCPQQQNRNTHLEFPFPPPK